MDMNRLRNPRLLLDDEQMEIRPVLNSDVLRKRLRTIRDEFDRTRQDNSRGAVGQVERALGNAGIANDRWAQSVPQPPRRLPQSDYRQHATRFYFESVTLRQLAAFAHNLRTDDPTLHVSSLNLTNRQPETQHFDVEVSLSYLV